MLSIQKIIFCLGWMAFFPISENRVSCAATFGIREPTSKSLKDESGLFSGSQAVAGNPLYSHMFPVGQGDAHIIECPNLDLSIIDMGSTSNRGFLNETWMFDFLKGKHDRIKSVVLSHNHKDHYSYIPKVLPAENMTSLNNIYISCKTNNMDKGIQEWANATKATIRMFNDGLPCGVKNISCGSMSLCPGDANVNVMVMAANLGNCTGTGQVHNEDSIVFKITHQNVSIIFNGDFQDHNENTDGHQSELVEQYGDEMKVTALKLAHHGARARANKNVSRIAHAPKAVFASSNGKCYGHPRCEIIDKFIELDNLCKPLDRNPSSKYFCGGDTGIDPVHELQTEYICGENNSTMRYVTNNIWAIYTTTPNLTHMNLVTFGSDGTTWGFLNRIAARYITASLELEDNECEEEESDI